MPQAGTVTFAEVDVRPPARSEHAACRLMLPDAFSGPVPLSLIAVSRTPRRFLGVAAVRPARSTRGAAWRLDLHVVPPYRRRGVGRRLLERVVARARQQGIAHLLAATSDDTDASGPFLSAAGFVRSLRVETFETDLDRHAPVAADLYERLRQKGRIPENARVVSLHEAPREALLALLAAPAGDVAAGNPGLPDLSWSDAWLHPSIAPVSPVVMDGAQPVGVVLAERRREVVTVIWRAVSPTHRLGWANILLGHIALTWMRDSGARRVRFNSTSLTTDTDRMARIFGAPRTAQTDHYALALQEGDHS